MVVHASCELFARHYRHFGALVRGAPRLFRLADAFIIGKYAGQGRGAGQGKGRLSHPPVSL